MSASGGVSTARLRGENRFYVSPGVRKQQQLQHQKQEQKQHGNNMARNEKRESVNHYESSHSTCSSSCSDSTNLDKFLEHTTPVVPVKFPSKAGTRERISHEPYFLLEDLWESFREWSAYGAGVPLLLNGDETVTQYYVPYLSGIQLYTDPPTLSSRSRTPIEESEVGGTGSDSTVNTEADRRVSAGTCRLRSQQEMMDSNVENLKNLSTKSTSISDSSSDECETSTSQGRLIYEYLEGASPFTRQPLSDKILGLASQFPQLRTLRSCDLCSSSWISVSWYPIYRIPLGPTLQNLEACFLTFHSLSIPLQNRSILNNGIHTRNSRPREFWPTNVPRKLPLPAFGLAPYKFKPSFWYPNGVYRSPKVNALLKAAGDFLSPLHIHHPDYVFFLAHMPNWT